MKNIRALIESVDSKRREIDSLKKLRDSAKLQGFSIDSAEGYRKIYYKFGENNAAAIGVLLAFVDGEINAKQAELDEMNVKANALDELLKG